MMDFSKKPGNVDEILRMISRVQAGRTVLESFLPLLTRRSVRIEFYPAQIVSKLKTVIGPDNPVGACFVPAEDPDAAGVIYLDMSGSLGVLAPFLVHEMVHALDSGIRDCAQAPRGTISTQTRDQIFLKAETRAFEIQHRFQQELKDRYPEYRDFLKAQYPRAKILNDLLTSEDISVLYGFKVS